MNIFGKRGTSNCGPLNGSCNILISNRKTVDVEHTILNDQLTAKNTAHNTTLFKQQDVREAYA